jgi:1-acyl-sn-glycerol-3-phosphate acyltransferase
MSSVALPLSQDHLHVPPAPADPLLGGIDPRLMAVLAPVAEKLLGGYFRAEVRGLSRIPRGAAIIAGNHNGGITFLEPIVFGAQFYLERGFSELIYTMAHDSVIGLPGLGAFLKKLGGLRAAPENARKVLAARQKLLVFPGGNREAWRPFSERHRVDLGGHQGFARLAVETDAPVVPLLSLGGHETLMILTRGERLARLLRADKLLRSKAFPVYLGVPWGLMVGPVFHLPLPARCVVEVGEPIVPSKVVGDLPAAERAGALYRLVSERLQGMMDRLAAERRWPVLG